jgi:hypothetical protein
MFTCFYHSIEEDVIRRGIKIMSAEGSKQKVVILGASEKKQRYSYRALKMLQEQGHELFLIHPTLKEIEGYACFSDLKSLKDHFKAKGEGDFDTLTVYVNPSISSKLKKDFLYLGAKRVIFNPGTENDDLASDLLEAGFEVEEACTLVLLQTGQF